MRLLKSVLRQPGNARRKVKSPGSWPGREQNVVGKRPHSTPARPKVATQNPSELDGHSSPIRAQKEYKALLSGLGIASDAPSAKSLGFVGPSPIERVGEIYTIRTGRDVEAIRIFLEKLRMNPNAQRLLEHILPQCAVENLVAFSMLSAHPGVGERFVLERDKRGEKIKSALRKRIRKNEAQLRAPKIIDPFGYRERQIESDKQILARAERAFDTRRMGLTENWPFLLVIFEYLKFRSGLTPRPRDMGALLEAAYAASGNPRIVDSDLLARGLRRYTKRHPDFRPSGSSSAKIIERRPLAAN
jgi:hypothetical protein